MLVKIASAVLVSGLLLATGFQSPAVASESGGGYDASPYVSVTRERQPDGSVVETTSTPGGTWVVIRDAKGKVISRKKRK